MLSLLSEIASKGKNTAYAFLCASLFAAVSCGSRALEINNNAQHIEVSTKKASRVLQTNDDLDERAARLKGLYNSRNCKEFFVAFPSNFEDFDQLYGFDDEKGKRVLYSQYEEHIRFFFDCPGLSSLEKLRKSIEIGIDGRWEADASTLVQEATFNLIRENPRKTDEILEGLPEERAASFWHFILDGPHPNDKEILKKVNTLRKILGKNGKQSRLVLEQHKRLLAEWREH